MNPAVCSFHLARRVLAFDEQQTRRLAVLWLGDNGRVHCERRSGISEVNISLHDRVKNHIHLFLVYS
jgi:hypothetical protein